MAADALAGAATAEESAVEVGGEYGGAGVGRCHVVVS